MEEISLFYHAVVTEIILKFGTTPKNVVWIKVR